MYSLLFIVLILVGIALVVVFLAVMFCRPRLDKETVVLDDVARKWEGKIDQNEHGSFFKFNYGSASVTVSNLWTRFEKPIRYSKVRIETVFANVEGITVIVRDPFIPLQTLSSGDPEVFIEDPYFQRMFFTQSKDPGFAQKLLGPRLRRNLLRCVSHKPVAKIQADGIEVSYYKQPVTEKEYDSLIDTALAIHDLLVELKRMQERKFL